MFDGIESYLSSSVTAQRNLFTSTKQRKMIIFITSSYADAVTQEGLSWVHKPYKSSTTNADAFSISEKNEVDVSNLSPSEQIRFIRETFSLNMSQIAELMEITRPTAYRWLDGKESDRGETAGKIIYLAKKAKSIKDKDIPRVDLLIKRPLFDGKSLLDLLKENKDISRELDELKSVGDREEKTRQSNNNPQAKNNISRILDATDELSTPICFEETIL
jgi:transcriptional regulator with XRE-family HTH domain